MKESNSETRTVSGEVTQTVSPEDRTDYVMGATADALLKDGYTGVVIQTEEKPFRHKLPLYWLLGMIVEPYVRYFTDQTEWSERVFLQSPDFDEGDEVTVRVEERPVPTDTALVAGGRER